MTTTKTIDTTLPNIAICFFTKMTSGSKPKLVGSGEQPYSYLNSLEISEGEHALVHTNNGFGLVQVARLVPLNTRAAAEKITKPLVAKVNIDLDRLHSDFKAISGAADTIQDSRRQSQIDDMLGIKRGIDGAVIDDTPRLFAE